MLVLHILSSPTESEAADLILGLAAAGVDQAVAVVPEEPRLAELERANIKIHLLKLRCDFLRRFFLRRFIARLGPDLIQCWSREAAGLVPVGKIPIIVRVRSAENPKRFSAAMHLVAATKPVAAHLEKEGASSARIDVIPAAVTLPSTPPQKRSALATPQGAKLLLCLSRLHPDKGIDVLLEALQELPDCYLWLGGQGPLRRELEELAIKLGVSNRVRFAGGMDPAALLRAADISVLPSRREPTDILAALSWAGGTPLVATACVEDSLTGLLVAPNDPAALARAIRRALDEGSLRQKLISQSYALYVRDHARESVIRQWVELYKKLFAETKKAAAL